MLTLVGIGKKCLPLRQSYFIVGQLNRECSSRPLKNENKLNDENGKYLIYEHSINASL